MEKRPQKFQSDYIKELNRKILYKQHVVIEKFKTIPESEFTEVSGGSSDVIDLADIVANINSRIKLMTVLYAQFKNIGIASCIIRNILHNESYSKVIKYYETFKQQQLSCVIDKPISIDLEKIMPIKYTPTDVLYISHIDDGISEFYPDAKVTIVKDTTILKDEYDLIIISHSLHHERIKNINSLLKRGGYLFVREIEPSDDFDDIYNFVHVLISGKDLKRYIYVSKKECMKLFESFKFVSESMDKIDLINNPLGTYCMLFKKE